MASNMNGTGGGASSYEEIMTSGAKNPDGGADALGSRLVSFRKWLTTDANCTVHPSICIVNGEATDGTKNAPVLIFGPPPSSSASSSGSGTPVNAATGRCGMIDKDADRAMYDRTMGCQIRAAREIKKDETMMSIPRFSMVTPDLVAASDAGRAVLACCKPMAFGGGGGGATGNPNFWTVFENTTLREKKYAEKISTSSGTQLLVKILQERKKAEKVLAEAEKSQGILEGGFKLAENGIVATRAPLLAFLIHQRFYSVVNPPVKSSTVKSFGTDIGTKREPDASDAVLLPCAPDSSPKSFGPYARTLPSYISLPICWKRNELALLAGCIPGTHPLQEVAARTMQLSADLIALVNGGLLHRFPDVFPPGLITWDRWVWAASVLASRSLPASCYLDRSDGCAADHRSAPDEQFYSPPEVWDELGVMVPLLDMLNHEEDANQVTWKPPLGTDAGAAEDEDFAESPHVAKAIMHKRVKKGCQIYTSYGVMKNSHMIGSYGFAQINNPSDDVRIGWGLFDGIGNVPPPSGYDISLELQGVNAGGDLDKQYLVYEAPGDEAAMNRWWTEDRLALLQKEAMVDDRFVSSLKVGKKMNALAYSDGNYHPLFLTAAVVATMPPEEVKRQAPILLSPGGAQSSIALTKRHQRILRRYLIFFLSQKLEKLLQNLNNGLKAHFNNVELWTKATDGGLQYHASTNSGEGNAIGWQAFFDSYAYATSMEVEKRYYAMGSDSCVLTLYDGSLRSLQLSIDGVRIQEKFAKGVLKQLEDFNMNVARDGTDEIPRKPPSNAAPPPPIVAAPRPLLPLAAAAPAMKMDSAASNGPDAYFESAQPKEKDKPPAVKLHVGNLSYSTTPAQLFDYFSGLYGRENVLECHIPTERDSNRSRGFGFVTMPKEVAAVALDPTRKHEIGDRLLKVAESNTAGSGRNPSGAVKGQTSSDRCKTCGYRPKYCTCSTPNIPGGFDAASHHSGSNAGSRPPEEIYGPPIGGSSSDYGGGYNDRPQSDYGDYGRSRHRSRSRSLRGRDGRSRSPRHSSRGGDRSRERYYDDYRRRSYSRSRSRERGRDIDRRDRSRSDRDRRSSRRSYSRSRSRSRDRGRSDRRDRDDEKRERKRRHRSRSRSRDRSGRSRKRSSKGSSRKDTRD